MTSVVARVPPEWRYALAALITGTVLTAGVTALLVRADADLAGEALEGRAERLAGEIQRVVEGHTAVLYGIRSLHLTDGALSRATFHRFVIDGGLLDRYPGAQAFEVAREVHETEVGALEAEVRVDTSLDPGGYPSFTVHPARAGEIRWVVDLIEPMASNAQAFGLDLGAEAERRAALLDARDHDEPRTTGPIRLVQEPTDQIGLLVVLPIYDGAALPDDVFERRRSTTGFALVVYRAGDMLAGVSQSNDDIAFVIEDVGRTGDDAARLLHASGVEAGPSAAVRFPVHGRIWSLRVSGLPRPTQPWVFPVFGGLATVVLAAFVYHLAATRRQATARARVLAASDAQRRRLERDLHDGAQQRLLSVSLLLARAGAGRAGSEVIRTARERIDESLRELRELARGLHPATVTDHGLTMAIEQLAGRSPVPVRLDLDPHEEPPTQVAVTAYYLVSEALANVARHARASQVTIGLRRRDERLVLVVRDDGIGGASVLRGTGLQGLVDRADAVGGKLTITSPPGGGTVLEVVLPCGS